MWQPSGFVYGFVNHDLESKLFTSWYSPSEHVRSLKFLHRFTPSASNFKFILLSLTAVPSLAAVQSFAWNEIWNARSSLSTGDWRQVKISVPANVLALKFEISALENHVSIDNILITPFVSVPFAYVVVGTSYCCVLHASVAQIRCWGSNQFGQLGQGNSVELGDDPGEMGDNLAAIDLGSGHSAKQVSAGGSHTCALLDDDSIKCWGSNQFGQLGHGNTVALGGNPDEMGDNLVAVDLGSGHSAKQVSAGGSHTCALLDDNSIKCWGSNQFGQLGQGNSVALGGNPDEMGDNLVAVDLGSGHSAKQVSAGGSHTCALLDDNSIKCWGSNQFGQLGQGNSVELGDDSNEMGDNLVAVDLGTGRSAKQVSAGMDQTCALLDDDSIKCWGYFLHSFGGPDGSPIASTIGSNPSEMGDNLTTVDLGTGRSAKQVSAGVHRCALLDNDSIKCWGYNSEGQLGQGKFDPLGDDPNEMGDNLAAVDLGSGRSARQVSAGQYHTCALLDDDSIKCWGGGGSALGQAFQGNVGDAVGEMGENLPPIDFGAIGLNIQTEVRIAGNRTQGRVQVWHENSWRDVCDDNWSNANAQVVCKQIGLAGGVANLQLQGSGDFGMDDVACTGSEGDLGKCSFRGWGIHDCSPQEAAGVTCHLDAWSSLADPSISTRRGHSAIWNDGSLLIYAGHAAGFFHYYNDLWRYKLGLWEELQAGPGPRGGHSAIWDLGSSTMMVFGGSYYTTHFDELWLYSVTSNSWSYASPSTKPSPRAYHTAVWDASSQIMLVFAGESGVKLQDFWQYSLVSNQWTELLPSEKPPARSRHTAVWMDALGAMLMFGGWGLTALDDLWYYGWWTNSWTLLSSNSPRRAGHTAIWEPFTLSILTFGGVQLDDSDAGVLNYSADLWNYSFLTNRWTSMAPVGSYPSPGPREDHIAAWDPSGFMYLVGGFDGSYKSDFWRYKSVDLEKVPIQECALGQECNLKFAGWSFEAGARLQVVNFLNGSDLYMFTTLDGYNFSLAQENATGRQDFDTSADVDDRPFLFAEPGVYRIRQFCPVDLVCDGLFDLGFLLVAGPFSTQTSVCDLGSRCVVTLEGSWLSRTDQLVALKECGASIQTSTFPAEPINASQEMRRLLFDLGDVELDGFAPEQVQLCWCTEGCSELAEFRALAMILHVVCPPGQQDIEILSI